MDKTSLFSIILITSLIICINSFIIPTIPNYTFYPNAFLTKTQDEDLKTYKEFQYSEDEIINFLYSNKTVPEGLYYETLRGHIYFSIEFSTNNLTEANFFFENNYPGSYAHLVETSENEKFFEFVTIRNFTAPAGGIYTETNVIRVHKASYIFLNESGYFHGLPDKLYFGHNESFKIGTLNQRPINSSNTKEVCSYIWFLRNWMMYGYKIANYVISVDNNSIYCMLLEIEVIYGDWGLYDRITLVYSKFSINRDNGSISIWREAFDEFEGEYHPNPLPIIDPTTEIFRIILVSLFFFSLLTYILWKFIKLLSNRYSIYNRTMLFFRDCSILK